MFGVKQVPVDLLLPDKTYCMFSHTIKAQDTNMPLLDEIFNKVYDIKSKTSIFKTSIMYYQYLTKWFLFVSREEYTFIRLREIDGFIRSKSSGFWEIRRNRWHNKYFTRFGIAITGFRSPHATNGELINLRRSCQKVLTP